MKATLLATLKSITVIAILATGLAANAGMTLKCSRPDSESLDGQFFLVVAGAGSLLCFGVDSAGKVDKSERYEVSFGSGGLGLEGQLTLGVTMQCWGDWPEFAGPVDPKHGDPWVVSHGVGASCGLALVGGQIGVQMSGKKRGCFIYGFQEGLGGSISVVKEMTMIKKGLK
jgi:hypothetical protein